jgi:WD40 repeat protein
MDLVYQAEEVPMMLESACLCLSFSRNSLYLVSGAQDGTICTWNVLNGSIMKNIPNAHNNGVASVVFSKEG